MPAISVIIPIYKVEPYLRRCLDSVIAQTFADYECILVDDASPDNCPAICDAYVEKDLRFKVIHKSKNEGLPKARKSGLDITEGEFVFHLDSDDWLEADALELLFKKQQETSADIVQAGIRYLYPERTVTYFHPTVGENKSLLVFYFLHKCGNIWAKLYRKIVFDDYIVPDMNIGEDIMVTIQLFSKLEKDKFQILDRIIYNYDRCSNSSMTINAPSAYICENYRDFPFIKVRLWMWAYLETKNITEQECSVFCYSMILNGINPYLRYATNIQKSDVGIFYREYYKPCIHKSKIKFTERIIIPIFYCSISIGKLYVLLLDSGIKTVKSIMGRLRKCFFI